MLKTEAIKLLGGTPKSAAEHIGCTPSAVHMWPDELTPIINDRVLAVQARRYLPPWVIGLPGDRAREPVPYQPEPARAPEAPA